MSSSTTAIVIACISAGVSLTSGVSVEMLRRRSAERRETASKAEEAQNLEARYRDPLLNATYDLQSRLYNVLRSDGFRGGRDPDYFRLNTLFLFAEFLAWLEIIRLEMQFLDLSDVGKTRELGEHLHNLRECMASTSTPYQDDFFLYRGEQRAIGEVMLRMIGRSSVTGPQRECIGYADFVRRQNDPEFAKWFARLSSALNQLPEKLHQDPTRPVKVPRLVDIQNLLIDLLDFLDPQRERFQGRRERLPDASPYYFGLVNRRQAA